MQRIYLDHAAAAPMHPAVMDAVYTSMKEHYGNPSSIHAFGREAKLALDEARDRIARRLGCDPSRLVFTSGGTESDNMAVFGAAAAAAPGKNHIVTTRIEHPAVLQACARLERSGYQVDYVPVNAEGRVEVRDVEAAIRPETCLVSVMYGNNEVGALQPVRELGERILSRVGVLFHTDAVQAMHSLDGPLSALPVHLASFSAHKINGPKGVGLLYIRDKTSIAPYLHGGSQERKRRSGTENLPAIAGFARAVDLVFGEDGKERRLRMEELRRALIEGLTGRIGPAAFIVNGHPDHYLPHIVNISFPGIASETMLMNLDLLGVAASSGSACSSGSLELSHVLQAMELPAEVLRSAIRFSFGLGTTLSDISAAADAVATIYARLRK